MKKAAQSAQSVEPRRMLPSGSKRPMVMSFGPDTQISYGEETLMTKAAVSPSSIKIALRSPKNLSFSP